LLFTLSHDDLAEREALLDELAQELAHERWLEGWAQTWQAVHSEEDR
jgi:hypothetical protein